MLLRLIMCGLLAACMCACESSKPTWATPTESEWDGWVEDVAKMREARKSQPAAGCLYSEAVIWDTYHDDNQSYLEDGRVLSLEWKGKEWDTIGNWEKGRKLILCYEEANGASLFDTVTKVRFPVRCGWRKEGEFFHPIDAYIASLDANNTYDMISACFEARRLWRLEIDRMVRKVLAKQHLPENERAEFIALTAVRVRYCELQASFGDSAIHADIKGTAAGPLGGAYHVSIYRDAYVQLATVADHLRAYDQEQEK